MSNFILPATLRRPLQLLISLAFGWAMWAAVAFAEDEFERMPIAYSRSEPNNAVSKLQTAIASGTVMLGRDPQFGYLPALLDALDVPQSSQLLVFSKTSMQRSRISPATPRAIYFNDDVYVGYCQSSPVMEISVADPQLGAVFYTLPQEGPLGVIRQTENCLICHGTSRTNNIPGHLVRSLFTDRSGELLLSGDSYLVDHRTPLENRWGGWYVTGTHGAQRHMGNFVVTSREPPEVMNNQAGQNVTQLDDRLHLDRYLTPHSDIASLMVLEHQTMVHNLITKASFEARSALYYEAELNQALGDPAEKRQRSTTLRIEAAGDALVAGLLMVDEAKLTAKVQGTSGYAEQFSARGPHDSQGRSLRELDLERRLFKYPCSYLVYSRAFDAMPAVMRDYVWQQMADVLSGKNLDPRFAHLSPADRRAIREILRETKSDLPPNW